VGCRLLIVGRGLPGGKFLFLSRQEKEPKEGDPNSPEFPKTEPAGRASKNSPRLAVFNLIFVGGTQTPSPLIRPAGSIFGGTERGGKSKSGQWRRVGWRYYSGFAHPAFSPGARMLHVGGLKFMKS
jgi:hypothetical protein